ncbi:hypothetical protein AAVH_38589, partial [Aphelenchoides avenae]
SRQWPKMREDALLSEQPGLRHPQYPPMLAPTAHPSVPMPVRQVHADAQCDLAEWELNLNTVHEYVMAEERSTGTAPMTLPPDSIVYTWVTCCPIPAPSHLPKRCRKSSRSCLSSSSRTTTSYHRKREVLSVYASCFNVLYLGGSERTTLTKYPGIHGQAQFKDAQVYELAE